MRYLLSLGCAAGCVYLIVIGKVVEAWALAILWAVLDINAMIRRVIVRTFRSRL